MLPYCKSYSMSNQHYLRIEIESLQCVDDQGVLCEPIIHDHVEAVQERRSLYNGLVVGIVQTLEAKEDKCTWLKSCRQNETDIKQSKGRVTEGGRDKEKRSEKDSRQTLNITLQHTAQTEETLSRWLPLTARNTLQGWRKKKYSVCIWLHLQCHLSQGHEACAAC